MSESVDPPGRSASPRSAYERTARDLAERIASKWDVAEPDALARLTDAVHAQLVAEANVQLRQILLLISGQLELAQANARAGRPPLSPEKIERMLGGIDRANAILDVYLNRDRASAFIIRLDLETFDLAEALTDTFRAHGLLAHTQAFSLSAEPGLVEGDRVKLVDCLTHVANRFFFSARAGEVTTVVLRRAGTEIEGFVGLSPSHIPPEVLLEEITKPIEIEDLGIEIGYVRAVIERHGGTLFVATAHATAVGLGFRLPGAPLGEGRR